MNKRFLLFIVLFVSVTFTSFSKPVKVTFTYNLNDVTLVYNDRVYKECPKDIAIDFDLGGSIVAFKPGYESQIIKVSREDVFSSYAIKLSELENKFSTKDVQVELKKASFINYVTNFTQQEVTEVINSKMNKNNITTYTENSIFKNVKGNMQQYSIGAEVLKSNVKNGAYTKPFYLLSQQKIKWYVLENDTNNLLLELTTDGMYMAYFKSKKGVVASDRLKEITVLALEEATQKFINSAEFKNLMAEIASR